MSIFTEVVISSMSVTMEKSKVFGVIGLGRCCYYIANVRVESGAEVIAYLAPMPTLEMLWSCRE